MTKRRGKSVSFDAMVKFFMHTYEIPTRRDIERLNERLERIERLLAAIGQSRPTRERPSHKTSRRGLGPAADEVLGIVRRHPAGIGLSAIQAQTGFNEKKMRNIVFRLHKQGHLLRKSRGVYAATTDTPAA